MTDASSTLAARADLARLLGACHCEPEQEFAAAGLFASLAAAAATLDPALERLARALETEFATTPLQELRIDYTRLFIGPRTPRAHPYASVWLDPGGRLMQASTLALTDLQAQAGVEAAEDFRDLPDHIAAELEFLYVLLFREAHAAGAGDPAGVQAARALRRRLLEEHLGRWVTPFAAAVHEEAETGFYRTLAVLTGEFVAREAALEASS